jgi:hypothetical protein
MMLGAHLFVSQAGLDMVAVVALVAAEAAHLFS